MNRFANFSLLSTATAALCLSAGLSQPVHAAPADGTVDLLTTPPELTAKVAPNVVLTFDDSGSMAWAYMPDQRPYDGESWSSSKPWYCAGVIDPKAAAGTPKSLPMNGVFYNPNVTYRPPLYENGSPFANAKFSAAWADGIQHNRPTNKSNSSTTNLSNTNFCGKKGAAYWRYTGPALSVD